MTILFVSSFKIEEGGGVGRVTEVLAREFIARGLSVIYCSFSVGSEKVYNGVTQYFVPDPQNIRSELNVFFLRDLMIKYSVSDVINQVGISNINVLRVINLAKSNVVSVYSVHHNCIKCLQDNYRHIISESYKKHVFFPLVNNRIGFSLLKFLNKKKYGYFFRYVIKHSDLLVLLSPRFLQELSVYIGSTTTSKVIGIPNPAPFHPVTDAELLKENRILYVGRLDYQQKRADLILPIWKKLSAIFPDWTFDVVGDGPVLQDLKNASKDLGLQRIHFHGYQDPKPFLEKAKVFIMTSAFEGFGMVLVEAQAYGVVPVLFRCFSSLDDIIESKKTGIIVDPFDVDAFASEVSEIMRNESFRKQMAENALKSIHKFESSRIADRWINQFETATSKK
jgi:glycosyltransferase involved in cell wall biosynthesis